LAEHPPAQFVTRSGHKLAAALDAFGVRPAGLVCADLGCNVGGFVDCLLQRGAARVYAVDTGYGALAWKLRTDPRVVTLERTNAMHVVLPEAVDLVTIDVAWTPQHRIVPHALELLKPGGRIVTLIKPHYEAPRSQLRGGVLPPGEIAGILEIVSQRLLAAGVRLERTIESPIPGHKGNVEYLALIENRVMSGSPES
jgi:23S rRNA (cytidine1920-2'-O)/16S rRNA (cytidine1409-2'-O)-methyltransferase